MANLLNSGHESACSDNIESDILDCTNDDYLVKNVGGEISNNLTHVQNLHQSPCDSEVDFQRATHDSSQTHAAPSTGTISVKIKSSEGNTQVCSGLSLNPGVSSVYVSGDNAVVCLTDQNFSKAQLINSDECSKFQGIDPVPSTVENPLSIAQKINSREKSNILKKEECKDTASEDRNSSKVIYSPVRFQLLDWESSNFSSLNLAKLLESPTRKFHQSSSFEPVSNANVDSTIISNKNVKDVSDVASVPGGGSAAAPHDPHNVSRSCGIQEVAAAAKEDLEVASLSVQTSLADTTVIPSLNKTFKNMSPTKDTSFVGSNSHLLTDAYQAESEQSYSCVDNTESQTTLSANKNNTSGLSSPFTNPFVKPILNTSQTHISNSQKSFPNENLGAINNNLDVRNKISDSKQNVSPNTLHHATDNRTFRESCSDQVLPLKSSSLSAMNLQQPELKDDVRFHVDSNVRDTDKSMTEATLPSTSFPKFYDSLPQENVQFSKNRNSCDYTTSSPFATADLLFNKENAHARPLNANLGIFREQSVEELLAAVERLDQAVDDLCEMSSIDELSNEPSLSLETDNKTSSPQRYSSDAPEIQNKNSVNDTLREFSAIHELCQTTSTSRFNDRTKSEANNQETIQIKSKENSNEKSIARSSQCEENNEISRKIHTDNAEQTIPSILNEAINKNCNFQILDPSHLLTKRDSFKRSCSADYAVESSSDSNESVADELEMTLSKDEDNCNSEPIPGTSRSLDDIANDTDDKGLVSTVTNVVRRSLRRVKRLRNSFGRGRRGDKEAKSDYERRQIENSEESGERQVLPNGPVLGLPGVRSPSATAILLPSIVASLAPNEGDQRPDSNIVPCIQTPRETLTPPPQSPQLRRSDSRAGGPSRLPPLSPSQHLPQFVSTAPNTNRRHTVFSTTPSSLDPRALSNGSTNTLPTALVRSGVIPTSNSARDVPYQVSTNPTGGGNSSLSARIASSQHSRSSSVPNGDTINYTRQTAHHTDIASVLISPARLPNNRSSPTRTGHSNTSSRTTSPRRPQGTSSNNNRRVRGRGSNNRERAANRTRGTSAGSRGSHSSSGSRHSSRSGHSVSTNPNPSTEVDANGSNSNSGGSNGGGGSNGRSRTCSRSSASRSSSVTVVTGTETPTRTEADSSNSGENNQQRRRSSGGGKDETCDPWSHHHSGLMASLSVTVTVFNISRFAVLGAEFGWPFLVQWVIASLVLGLPLLTLHAALGQHTGLGALQLWKVAPIFQGVGISLILAQLVLGVYCSIPVAWLFVYFRDSFITQNGAFIWSWCRRSITNCTEKNISQVLIQSIPIYLSSDVQQRNNVDTWQESLGSLKVNLIFNVVLIFMLTIFALCRGNKLYGKISYIVFIVPLLCFLAVCLYVASLTQEDLTYVPDILRSFVCRKSWVAASREVFLVWGLHGPVLQQMTAFNKRGQSVRGHIWLLSVTTMLVLVLAAVTGSCCAAAFKRAGLVNTPSSFETAQYAQFLTPVEDIPKPPIRVEETPTRTHYYLETPSRGSPADLHSGCLSSNPWRYDSLYAGIRVCPHLSSCNCDRVSSYQGPTPIPPTPGCGQATDEPNRPRSGYQSIRLATELFPAFLGVHGSKNVSPFWSSLFYFSLLMFGLAQQLAVWRCIVEVVVCGAGLQKRRGLVTICCCLMGLSLALPLATELGPDLLFFLDYIIGCAWWLMILQLVQVFAILFVRGKPMSALDLITTTTGGRHNVWTTRSVYIHITAFSCSILVPVGLLVLSISSFQSGHYKEVFTWSQNGYWPVWVSQLASGLQLLPILLVPLVALAQTCRFLANTNYDIFQRVQMLYRPNFAPRSNCYRRPPTPPLAGPRLDVENGQSDIMLETPTPPPALPFSDPPPKYTPPPSYSTATGTGIAKALNQSLRRSIRHLRSSFRSQGGNTGTNTSPQSPALSATAATAATIVTPNEALSPVWTTQEPYIPPADYANDSSDAYSTTGDVGGSASSLGNAATAASTSHSSGGTEPPPLYSTLDPLARQRVLRMLQRAGIRRSSGTSRSSSRRSNNNRNSDENSLVPGSNEQTPTLELQGLDHLAFDYEVV